MARSDRLYRDGAPARTDYAGFDPDTPVEGFYRVRLRSGGAYVGCRIWHGTPREPWSGEEMDRAARFQAEINGSYVELETVWPRCAADPITEAEYQHLCHVQKWAVDHAPGSGLDDPRKPIDPLNSPIVF